MTNRSLIISSKFLVATMFWLQVFINFCLASRKFLLFLNIWANLSKKKVKKSVHLSYLIVFLSEFDKMEPAKQADLLLLTTIGIFVILTFFAFLMNEGKEMVVVPAFKKLSETFGCTCKLPDKCQSCSNKDSDSMI